MIWMRWNRRHKWVGGCHRGLVFNSMKIEREKKKKRWKYFLFLFLLYSCCSHHMCVLVRVCAQKIRGKKNKFWKFFTVFAITEKCIFAGSLSICMQSHIDYNFYFQVDKAFWICKILVNAKCIFSFHFHVYIYCVHVHIVILICVNCFLILWTCKHVHGGGGGGLWVVAMWKFW